ncbi:MAG: pantoate--beta-alanine ligase [Hyphomicrobium sp. 32-62-53]|nr:MAG: pantoate--beta-alanine ligase [Hyphomicrobium sp. 12-62-95]OYX98613.1 MAG: pantoate--beta-alanine ligase [Hyphomicrobium sp. 32-62-53]
MPPPRIVRTVKALRSAVQKWRAAGESVALVPTMGALHDGHLTLVSLARRKADWAVVSIFVNPTQFGPTEDLSRYPRDEAGDARKLGAAGTDLIWAPAAEEMYPDGFATTIVPKGAALPLEGEFRPHHFAGVATVCTKLFSQVTPDAAIFGEKDYQQLCVIRQTVADLNLPVKIVAAPTSRDRDGLARSSRNAYLTADEREAAPALNRALKGIAAIAAKGGLINKAIDVATHDLLQAGFTKVDYLTVRDAETLAPFEAKAGRPGRVLGAAWLGTTRLIDNIAV